ncbi:MAG: NAD(P)/FAD-dependent oxidoreductase [bacterium]
MDNKYDVIIIGAGPAGLKCAEQLKGSKLSVLLIEKNKIIGPKVCGGGLTNLSAEFDLPVEKTRSFTKQLFYLNGQKCEVELAAPLRTINRYDLGQYLLTKIKDADNITILKEVTVESITEDSVVTDKGNFYYKQLVGADGANSLVRKFLGLPTDVSVGIRCKVDRLTQEIEWHFYPSSLKFGYIWILPHKDYSNVGIYFHPQDISATEAMKLLKNFLAKNNFSYSDMQAATLNSLYKGCIFKNIFLAGEAAGVTSMPTGEGMPLAMFSGREVGKKILDPDYKMRELDRNLKFKRRQEKFTQFADCFPFARVFFIKVFLSLYKSKWFQNHFIG